ncbi:vWA domain-containing protein [Deinococcus aerophilus]|uniref:VWFA domain-containing protein n=1 Tax=Deinococcus aerophilus TaxID=522488 RepID=A0ABQ2GZH7_9DEIO|nr:VWA domain-containing protein [Deinococcus aerophilus]GGM19430.1 hypothetical protein GCM10010841_29330 [Deinococcus aerophilus]
MHEPQSPTAAPRIELLPLKAGLPEGQAGEVTVLARLYPAPPAEVGGFRPPLNLALVIDRSGSMSGPPLAMARRAVQVALQTLQPHDRVSVVAFDGQVEPVVMPQLVNDPQALCRAVEGITAGGSTALHAGWLEGAMLSAQFHDPRALNRVLLLSDGQANAGETRPEVIAQHVRGLNARGVGTSTVGLGRSYDETLLQAMADAGDGNYEHIEDAEELPGFFQTELQGLTRTTGLTVSLGVEPNPALGSLRQEVLNDLPRNDLGRWQLPNLIAGRPLEVVFTVQIPAQQRAAELGVTRVRVAWTDREGRRHRLRAQLNLPVLGAAAYDRLAEDERVRVAAERLRAARVREQAVAYAVAGQVQLSRETLVREHRRLAAFQSTDLAQEVAALSELDADFGRDEQLARKRAASQSYNTRRSKDPQSR